MVVVEAKLPRVLILQVIVPHYRVPFFQKLCSSKKISATIAYGMEPIGSSLKSIQGQPSLRFFPLQNHFFGMKNKFVYQSGLVSLLNSREYDVVIAGFDIHILSNLLLCLFARRNRIKFIWWGHGIGPKKHWISKIIRLWLINNSDAIIFYDEDHANMFIKWGTPKEKVFIAWNSIDTDDIVARAKGWSESYRNRIVYIGRLVQEKKVDLLIRGFTEARKYLSNEIKLTIIGSGPELTQLKQLAELCGVSEYVDFTGEIYNQEELTNYFNSALVTVSPGCIGLSIIHSFAYGIPLLVADKEPHGPELSAFKEGENGIYFSAGSSESLSQSLIDILSNREALSNMSVAAKNVIQEKFNLTSMVNGFEDAVQYSYEK